MHRWVCKKEMETPKFQKQRGGASDWGSELGRDAAAASGGVAGLPPGEPGAGIWYPARSQAHQGPGLAGGGKGREGWDSCMKLGPRRSPRAASSLGGWPGKKSTHPPREITWNSASTRREETKPPRAELNLYHHSVRPRHRHRQTKSMSICMCVGGKKKTGRIHTLPNQEHG